MNEVNCICRRICGLVSVIASIIVGIITTILTITATITVTPAFYWVALGIAVVFLALLLVTTQRRDSLRCCLCPVIRIQLIGILGTVLASLILLGVGFVATSILGAIITGALLLFLSLIITATACIVRCLANCDR